MISRKGGLIMMDYQMMGGGAGSNMLLFAWLTYILVIAALVLLIMALWKYISKA